MAASFKSKRGALRRCTVEARAPAPYRREANVETSVSVPSPGCARLGGLTVEALRRVSLFAAASDEDAHWLLSQCILVTLAPDEWLRREGDPAEFYVMLEGELRITKQVGGVDTYITTFRDGDFFGEVPLLLGMPFMVSGRAVSPCRLLRLAEEAFWGMLTECLSANRQILRKLAERTQLLQSITAQQEKLAALGTLAAGLAHELNNPVSAVVSGVGELEGLLRSLPSLALRIDREALSEAQRTCLETRAGEGPPVPAGGVLARGDAEEALVAWLEAREVEDAWELAPTLVEAGLDAARLERDFVGLLGATLAVALRWLATTRGAVSALEQIRQGGLRIAALVDAAKAYAYLDQAPVQEVDVHEGLESTLTMLGFRLHGVEVVREYDRRLPRITAYGNELNQVWTSLVENALDAMGEHGCLHVRTWREPDHVVVDVIDDGPGIPRALQPRVFDPFFTTKGVGQGTGLGLSVAHRIVASMHRGELTFASEPGRTCFRVRLPIRLEARG